MKKKIETFCQICLRVDRKLKVVESWLTDFHDELCDYPLITNGHQFCCECEHLLRKLYIFKLQCVNAKKILRNWKKTTTSQKKPANLLYTLLPPSSLGFWTPHNNKIYFCTYEETELTASSDEQRLGTGPSVNLEFIDSILLNEDIKLEGGCKSDLSELLLQDLNTLKAEDSTSVFVEVPILEGSFKNAEISRDDDRKQFNEDVEKEDNLGVNGGDMKSVSINHCYFKDETNSPKKSSLSEPSFPFSDDDLSCDGDEEQKFDTEKDLHGDNRKIQKHLTKQKMINKSDNKKQRITKKIVGSGTKNEMCLTKKYCENVKSKHCEKIKNRIPYSKERLKERLMTIFESCGEVTTDDGTVIDKKFIINSLDDKVTESVMRLLWKALHTKNGKQTFRPRAFKIFKTIQSKHKEDAQYETVFDIEYLTTEEEMMEEFRKRKTYECYLNAEHKCEICYQGFKYKKSLEYHQKSHEVSASGDTCSICGIGQRDKARLKLHIHKVHGAVYKCKLCPLVTYYRQSMVNHYNQHKGVQYRCEPCGMTFNSRSVHLNHQTSQHSSGRHACTACGRAFVSELGLREHTTRKHKDDAPTVFEYKCEHCELAFPSEEVHRRHVRTTHERRARGGAGGAGGDRPYRPRTTLASLRNRVRAPRKEIVMTCRVCKATGNYYGWLYLHFRMKHPTLDMALVYADRQKHLCHMCGKGFSSAAMLRNHLNAHTDVRPFACDACPKRFNSNYSLYSHRLLHLPPAKSCPHCCKKFHTQSNLTNHMRTHIGNRRYKCSICGKGFLHRHSLNEHVRGVHNHVSRVKKRRANETGVTESGVTESGSKKMTLHMEEGSE